MVVSKMLVLVTAPLLLLASLVSAQNVADMNEGTVYDGTDPKDSLERKLQGLSTQNEKPNLLFIMTDQHRFDALSFAGNTILKTPNLDRIASEGVFFKNAYSACPICGPARTSLLTGLGIENTGVTTNNLPGKPNLVTYDQKLVEEGNYVAEYYGKWHSPNHLASVYQNEVDTKTFNIFGPYWKFLRSRNYSIPEFPIREGLVIDSMTQRGYKPVRLDSRFLPENRKMKPACGCDQYGFQKISPGRTITAFEAKRVIRAISRLGGLKKAPFSLHVSFNSPHGPHTPVRKFAKLYQPRDMPVPPSINDTMADTPYAFLRKEKYSDPATIGHFIRLYYAQVKEVDHWIGRILGKLDRKGFTNNTMLVFTSDHGEMMGNHGFIEKGVLYEESARIPMLMRFPGRIPAGTVVDETVSHLDVFATILDYMGLAAQPSDGESLRSLIEKAQPTAASTSAPPSLAPTTASSAAPTTSEPSSAAPTSAAPTSPAPTSAVQATSEPTSAAPTSAAPTSAVQATSEPTSAVQATSEPTSAAPTSAAPTSAVQATSEPTSAVQATSEPTSAAPTSAAPTSAVQATSEPTSAVQATSEPTSAAPTSAAPTEQPHFTVIETGDFYQQFMVRSGDWKLIISNRAQSYFFPILFNLKEDPYEIVNLIGPSNPERANYLVKANELKELLVQWCVRTNSPYTDETRQRVIS